MRKFVPLLLCLSLSLFSLARAGKLADVRQPDTQDNQKPLTGHQSHGISVFDHEITQGIVSDDDDSLEDSSDDEGEDLNESDSGDPTGSQAAEGGDSENDDGGDGGE